MYPASFTPCRNAATLDAYPPGELLWRKLTTGIAVCCARPATGHVAAAPTSPELTPHAGTSRAIDTVFAAFARERPDAVFLGQDPFFNGRRLQLANWAVRHALPMTSGSRDICEVGGLMSYGANIVDSYRQEGVYVGRILKGAKPADLPVEQFAKFELVINAQTARMLGLEIPPTLLARADEVIE
jgi:putative tryptophan/tyrosine transport system substrate-binding protein